MPKMEHILRALMFTIAATLAAFIAYVLIVTLLVVIWDTVERMSVVAHTSVCSDM